MRRGKHKSSLTSLEYWGTPVKKNVREFSCVKLFLGIGLVFVIACPSLFLYTEDDWLVANLDGNVKAVSIVEETHEQAPEPNVERSRRNAGSQTICTCSDLSNSTVDGASETSNFTNGNISNAGATTATPEQATTCVCVTVEATTTDPGNNATTAETTVQTILENTTIVETTPLIETTPDVTTAAITSEATTLKVTTEATTVAATTQATTPVVTTQRTTQATTPLVTTQRTTKATTPAVTTQSTTKQTTETSTVDDTTTLQTTAITSTTEKSTVVAPVVCAQSADLICLEFYWLIIIGVVVLIIILLVIFLMWFCCIRRTNSRDVETAMSTATLTNVNEISNETWRGVMEKEDMLKDALNLGKIDVLAFAIKQAKTASIFEVDSDLIASAEAKLNEWKRSLFMLEGAVKDNDLTAMEDYSKRFEELEIKDDTGVYQKCIDMQWKVSEAKARLRAAVVDMKEEELKTAIAKFRELKLPIEIVKSDPDLLAAIKALDQLNEERLLKGRSQEELVSALREATEQRDAGLINIAAENFIKSGIPDLDEDLEKAKIVLGELDAERESRKDEALQKLLDASQSRNAAQLRDSLRNCSHLGVDIDQILNAEKLLKTVEREDQLLKQMKELIETEDSGKLLEAIAVFRTPGLQLVDKTGDVARADELMHKLREKQRQQRAKGDAMWRLQAARNVGDAAVMANMIKVLENLQSAGEEIDEAMLLRAKTELDQIKGQLDYRKQMEAIKSAISRMIQAENLQQLSDLIEQMVELSADPNLQLTGDDTRVLDESRSTLHALRRKRSILDELEVTRPLLQLPQLPDELEKLEEGVRVMTRLKDSASEFSGVFLPSDDVMLTTATTNAGELKEKVDEMRENQEKLKTAMDLRDIDELLDAIKLVEEGPFPDETLLKTARDLAAFIDPRTRKLAVTSAVRNKDIEALAKAITDFIEAGVSGEEEFIAKAERTLMKLEKIERKREKAEKRRRREEAKREEEINHLTDKLNLAIDSRDIHQLQDAMDACENSGYRDDEIPMFNEAEDLFDQLTIAQYRADLKEAMARRDIFMLEKTIDAVDYGGYIDDLKPEYEMAKEQLFHLRELRRLRDAIAGMNRSLISEIQRYPTPPGDVHIVMTAALMMLGDKERDCTSWPDVQNLIGKMGKSSITRRVRHSAPGDVTKEIRRNVERKLEGLDIVTMEGKSKGAAAFFAWMRCMLKESLYIEPGEQLPPESETTAL